MADPTSLLVTNLGEPLKQINQYVALSLITSVSACALDFAPGKSSVSFLSLDRPVGEEPVTPFQGFVPMSRDAAMLLLVGISFAAAVMGSYAADSAIRIIEKLSGSKELITAACMYPSVATSPVGFRILVALLPVLFVGTIFWHHNTGRRVRKDIEAFVFVLLFFSTPFLTLALQLGHWLCK